MLSDANITDYCYLIGSVHYLKIGDEYVGFDKGEEDVESIINTYFIQEEKQEKFHQDFNKLRSYSPNGYSAQLCEEALWEILDKIKNN